MANWYPEQSVCQIYALCTVVTTSKLRANDMLAKCHFRLELDTDLGTLSDSRHIFRSGHRHDNNNNTRTHRAITTMHEVNVWPACVYVCVS